MGGYDDPDEIDGRKTHDGKPDIISTTKDKEGDYHSYNDEPSIVFDSKKGRWHRHGLRHRLTGPAVMWNEGTAEYYIEGIICREGEFEAKVRQYKIKKYLNR